MDGMFLGIIPARSGSKGVPDKNIRDFAGTSLLQLAIEAGAGASLLTDTIVSTDSEEIADRARLCGGKVPFLRPKELSFDDVPIWRVLSHILKEYEKKNQRPDYFVTMQPTSPFRTSQHIDDAIRLMLNSKGDSLASLSEATHTPYKMRIIKDGYVENFMKDHTVLQRQEAPSVYNLNGVVYITKSDVIEKYEGLWGERTIPYILPEAVGMNIDSMNEFSFAERLFLNGNNR